VFENGSLAMVSRFAGGQLATYHLNALVCRRGGFENLMRRVFAAGLVTSVGTSTSPVGRRDLRRRAPSTRTYTHPTLMMAPQATKPRTNQFRNQVSADQSRNDATNARKQANPEPAKRWEMRY
jgi:hypothetical protein